MGMQKQNQNTAPVLENGKPIAENKEPIKIGAILPLSGKYATWGEESRKVIDLSVEQLNAQDGIDGRNIEIIYEDCQEDSTLAVTATHCQNSAGKMITPFEVILILKSKICI